MSRKSQKRRGPRPAGSRSPADARQTSRIAAAPTAGRAIGWRSPWVVGGVALVTVALVVGIAAIAFGGSGKAGPTPTSTATAEASALPGGSSSASSGGGGAGASSGAPGASGGPTASPGGKLAEAVVTALHVDPFVAHVEESILASEVTNGTRLNVTAKAVGDVHGRDVAIRTTGTGNGPATDEQVVAVGDVAWLRQTDGATWEVHPRSLVAPSLDGLLGAIQPLDDPNVLVDLGPDTVDGQAVRHLTAVGAVAYQSLNGAEGDYDTFDIWVTDAGSPVLMKATFSEFSGANSITGSTEIHYTKVGGPITISPPAGGPTLAPSTAPSPSAVP